MRGLAYAASVTMLERVLDPFFGLMAAFHHG